jgi:hypothetical protein
MSDGFIDWANQKADIALALANGQCGGGYAESVLIFSATISGIASVLWPGDFIDKKRFVELWARYAGEENLISLPLLIDYLESKDQHKEQALACADVLRNAKPETFGSDYEKKGLTSKDVDLSEPEVLLHCPNILRADVRKYCYGSVFYTHVRSAFVHNYELTSHATSLPMSPPGSGVSYSNVITQKPYRRIHFEPDWLSRLVRRLASAVAPQAYAGPLARPGRWWLEGD